MLPCAGFWLGYRNQCRCPCCRRVAQTRSAYIDANEAVARCHVLPDDPDGLLTLTRIQLAREDAAAAWAAAAAECLPARPSVGQDGQTGVEYPDTEQAPDEQEPVTAIETCVGGPDA